MDLSKREHAAAFAVPLQLELLGDSFVPADDDLLRLAVVTGPLHANLMRARGQAKIDGSPIGRLFVIDKDSGALRLGMDRYAPHHSRCGGWSPG